ncbi:unnamed protein product [Penicillium roqueforti FM164]|uniref:Uncharacterized protein n=1 Tax=Penicillium roqueforti (strain FM164) TaxID=1365484 RepID=W6QJJ0_PENRF|nr:unnamed protein product [Penicillium roqueforti FM164]
MDTAETDLMGDLVGTEITTDAKTETNLLLPSVTWVITAKLNEISYPGDQHDIEKGFRYLYVAAKFLCYRKDNPAQRPAFVRIYQQIPITGTQISKSNDIIPSGFITYIIWEKVPGVPLSKLYIWRQTPEVRDAMRKEFRRVYHNENWSDFNYVLYGLVRPRNTDWYQERDWQW